MLTLRSPESRFWLFILIAFVLLVWLLKSVLLPFVAGFAIAYFFNPVVNRIAGSHLPRWVGTTSALLLFILFAVLILVLIVPLIQSQVVSFLQALPSYVNNFKQNVVPWAEHIAGRFAPNGAEQLQNAAQQYAGSIVGWVGDVLQNVISRGMAIFDVLTLLIVTPVVAFYLLRDWPTLTQVIDDLIPRRYYDSIQTQLQEIDQALSGFVRGQALVCLALGIMYSVGLTLTGLNYGATIGIVAGILSFIPYVGTAFGCIISLLIALAQFNDPMQIGFVMSVFVVGQVIESYFLTPKLVGDRVGLHPVWILFALFVGGALMGFVGILIAVPVAAAIGVLVRHGVRGYKQSVVYNPVETPTAASMPPVSPPAQPPTA